MVMGYHRPVSEFNRGKKKEFAERKCFTEEKAVEHLNNNVEQLQAAE
jgi:ribonucleoside-triphosphate reductase